VTTHHFVTAEESTVKAILFLMSCTVRYDIEEKFDLRYSSLTLIAHV
jgi:hypothetical protein